MKTLAGVRMKARRAAGPLHLHSCRTSLPAHAPAPPPRLPPSQAEPLPRAQAQDQLPHTSLPVAHISPAKGVYHFPLFSD